jgi:hypothetical protein
MDKVYYENWQAVRISYNEFIFTLINILESSCKFMSQLI